MEILSWLIFVVFIAALLIAGGLLLRGYLNTGTPKGALKDALSGNFFGPRAPKRLEVTDQANVDGRRKLLLIRRDGIEHDRRTGRCRDRNRYQSPARQCRWPDRQRIG